MRINSSALLKRNNHYMGFGIHLISIFFIIILSNVSTLYSILPTSWDECGYIGQAKLLAGDNWSNVISQMPYYSFGCSILPSFIMRLGLPYYIEYRMILVINSLLLIGIYFISVYLIRKLYKDLPNVVLSIIALIMVCYPSNIAFSNFLLSENYLTFFFYVVCLAVVKYIKTEKNRYLVICAGIAAFMFYIHNRAIAVVIAVLIFSLFNVVIKKDRKELFVAIFILIIAFLILWMGNKYKVGAQDTLWSVKSDLSSVNDIGAVEPAKMLKDLFNIKTIGTRMIMAGGKIWYLLVSTLGLIAIGICLAFKKVYEMIKKSYTVQGGFSLFLLLSFIGTCGVFFLLHASVIRIDHIIIGRYLDYMVGPFLMLGLCELYYSECSNLKRVLTVAAIIIVIMGKVIEKAAGVYMAKGIYIFDRLSNAEWEFMWKNYYVQGMFGMISVISFVLVLLIIKLLPNNKMSILILYLAFNVISVVSYNDMVIEKQKNDNYTLVKLVETIGADDVVGFLPVDTGAVKIQYMLPDNEIQPIYNIKKIGSEKYTYIFSSQPIINTNILDDYTVIYESKSGYLYKLNNK